MTSSPQENTTQWQRFYNCLPGIALCSAMVIASFLLAKIIPMSDVLICLIIGMVLNLVINNFGSFSRLTKGIDFCANWPLQIGTALLGLKITRDLVSHLSIGILLLIVGGVFLTIFFSLALNKFFKWKPAEAAMIGASVSICGASAVMALVLVIGKETYKRQNIVAILITVMVLSSIAMLTYPYILQILGISGAQAGFVLGGAIHNTSQVVGASAAMGEESLAIGTMTKMLRVVLLIPVALLFIKLFPGNEGEGTKKVNPLTHIPIFLIFFLIFAALNLLEVVPAGAKPTLSFISTVGILLAVAAIGLKTNVLQLRQIGIKPIIWMMIDSIFLLAWMILGVMLLGRTS